MDYNSYGGYGSYPKRPVSVFWSTARVPLRRYCTVLGRFGWVLRLTISLGVCLSAWVVAQMPADYVSTSKMIVSGQIQFKEGEGAVYSEQVDNFYGTQIELMESLEVQKRAVMRVQTLHPEFQPEEVTLEVKHVVRASTFVLRVEDR